MATIGELEAAGVLHRYDPALDEDEQELRLMHTSTKLRQWVGTTLGGLRSQWNVESSPAEQFDALMAVYASGLPLVFDRQFKAFQSRVVQHAGDGVWYFKTADLRIFGWFRKKDCFIGVVANTAEAIKQHDLYAGYRGEVVRFRDQLDLDEPKYIPGTNPDDVVSNYCLPD